MAASIDISYIIEESGLRTNLATSEIANKFLIKGLDPTLGVIPGAQIFNDAYTALLAIYPFASTHPSNPRMIADDYEIKPYLNSKTQCIGIIRYHPIDWSSAYQPRITFTATSREVLTNYAADGSVIKVNYKPGSTTDPGAHVVTLGADGYDTFADGITTVIGEVVRNKKYGLLEIERVEYASPRPKLVYLDRMNTDVFWGLPKYTWLVNNIVISKLAYTSGFNVRYLLEYDPQTHIKTAVYRSEISGTIPSDVNTNPNPLIASGNGWRNSIVAGTAVFAGLGLPDDFV